MIRVKRLPPGTCPSWFYKAANSRHEINPHRSCDPQTFCDYERGTWERRCRYCGQSFEKGAIR